MEMSNLSMVEAKLPPGFRFHPKDSELICDYLMNKVAHSNHLPLPLLIQVDLNNCEPWDIPETACVGSKEWYFYSHRDRKYASGVRTNRATTSGYWKATGKDRPIIGGGTLGLVGMRKTLVFYQGRAPKGTKTEWVMHEFRLAGPLAPPHLPSSKEDLVLCRVFNKNKEAPAKQAIEINYDDTSSSTSFMEPYITCDQTQAKNNSNQYEQVPCFSNFTQNQINPTFSHITHMDPIIPTISTAPTFGVMPKLSEYANPPSCEKMVIKAVLNHLNKMDGYPPNLKGSIFEEASSESFLSEVGLPNMWNYYGF